MSIEELFEGISILTKYEQKSDLYSRVLRSEIEICSFAIFPEILEDIDREKLEKLGWKYNGDDRWILG